MSDGLALVSALLFVLFEGGLHNGQHDETVVAIFIWKTFLVSAMFFFGVSFHFLSSCILAHLPKIHKHAAHGTNRPQKCNVD